MSNVWQLCYKWKQMILEYWQHTWHKRSLVICTEQSSLVINQNSFAHATENKSRFTVSFLYENPLEELIQDRSPKELHGLSSKEKCRINCCTQIRYDVAHGIIKVIVPYTEEGFTIKPMANYKPCRNYVSEKLCNFIVFILRAIKEVLGSWWICIV